MSGRVRSPEGLARNRESSRAAKRRRTGVCKTCGATTRYHGRGRDVSDLCHPCASAARRVWTRETIIAAVQQWAAEHGRPPAAADWVRGGRDHPPISSVYRTRSKPHSPFAAWAGPWCGWRLARRS